MNVIDQASGDNWTLYHGDCVDVLSGLPDESIHYSVFSPPFASLYTYSASPRDMGNTGSHEEFFEQHRHMVDQLYRVLKPGRLFSAHCMLMPTSKTKDGYIGLIDFRGQLIRQFQEAGFIFHSEVCIWKDPVTAMQRTKALGLLHKQVKKDSCMSRQGLPDYLVTMRKPGDNPEPVANDLPVQLWQHYASPVWATLESRKPDHETYIDATRRAIESWSNPEMDPGFYGVSDEQIAGDETSGIDATDTLQYRSAREHEDERHICPLQLEVIRRAVKLWTNPGDVVLSPFTGIGSEGYTALKMGRRFIGAELKASYFKQAARNLAAAGAPAQTELAL